MIVPQTIYAGDTPLASTLVVEQTGPLELTVRAGSFTTTGEARIRFVDDHERELAAALVASGDAEWLDAHRVRVWLGPSLKAKTYALGADESFLVAPGPVGKYYRVDLGADAAGLPVLVARSRLARGDVPALPTGLTLVHPIVFEFEVALGALQLDDVPIRVFTVLPGFPPGTGPNDAKFQTGQVQLGGV